MRSRFGVAGHGTAWHIRAWHGTALDLAGKGSADSGSLVAAVEMAVEMVGQSTGAH